MRGSLFCLLVVLTLASSALAETSEEKAAALVAEGEALGKAGQYDEALVRFREAESLHPRAAHDCYIAIALMRQKRLTYARWSLSRCKSRAATFPPVPWYEDALEELARAMPDHGLLTVTVVSGGEPLADARVEVSSFGDLDIRPADTIWVPPGSYEVTVTHPVHGHHTRTVAVTARGETPVVFDLRVDRPAATSPSRLPAYLTLGAAVATAAVGGAFHIATIDPRKEADGAMVGPERDAHLATFKRNRAVAISLYGVSAALVGAGVVLLLRDGGERSMAVSAGPTRDGGGAVVIGGRF